MHSSPSNLPLRDQIALDIYKHAVSGYQRFFPVDTHAKVAEASYHATDAFLAEMAKQAPAPEAPTPPTPAEGELDDDHPLWGINAQITGLLEGDGANEDHEMVIHFLRQTGLPKSTVDRIHKAICCAEVAKPIQPIPAENKPDAPAEERKTVTPKAGKRYYLRTGENVKIEWSGKRRTPFRALLGSPLICYYLYYLPDGRHESNPRYDLVDECPF